MELVRQIINLLNNLCNVWLLYSQKWDTGSEPPRTVTVTMEEG